MPHSMYGAGTNVPVAKPYASTPGRKNHPCSIRKWWACRPAAAPRLKTRSTNPSRTIAPSASATPGATLLRHDRAVGAERGPLGAAFRVESRRRVFDGAGETDGHAQARAIVGKLDRCAVQIGDGFDEGETQSVARRGPARLEPVEAPE